METKVKSLTPNTDAAVEFLIQFHPGPYHLVATTEDKPLIGQTFDKREPMWRWINDCQGKWNVYFHVARLKGRPKRGKATKKEVAITAYLHLDVDNAKAETLARLRAWRPKFTAIVMSGGGYHAYYRLSEPTDDFKSVETCNKALTKIFDGDKNAHNVDRILRLPGTINLPNATKRAKGRNDMLAQLIEADWSRSYDLALLEMLTSKNLAAVMSGSETHYPALQLVGQLIHVTDDDGLIEQIVSGLLPPDYKGDTKSELSGFIRSARDKIASGEWRPEKSEEDLLARMNSEYCVIQDGGKTRVLRFDIDEQVKDRRILHRRRIPTYFGFGDFHNFYKNETVWMGGKAVPLGNWWTSHPHRRSYKGLTFRPDLQDEVVNGRLNLWRGWGVEPKQGDWSLMRRHIKEVVASDNPEHDGYIMNWLGWTVQHPAEPAEVALMLRGGKGDGKGTLGNTMCHVFGQHAVHLSSVRHLIGHFNVHLRDACFLFADEAYWPGDKSAEGTLKRLITEPTLIIEPKFVDAMTVRNMLHVLISSNEDRIVPASEGERRFAAFLVSKHKRQDESWFGPIYKQLENGGYAAMLYDLLRLDLGDWHPRKIPMTDELREQQIRSLNPLDAWVLEFVETGVLPASDGVDRPCRALSHTEPDFDQRNPRNGLLDLARERHLALRYVDDQVLTNHLRKWGCWPWRNNTQRGWEFPPLAECRAKWEERYPGWQWRHPDLTDWQEDDIDQPAVSPGGRIF